MRSPISLVLLLASAAGLAAAAPASPAEIWPAQITPIGSGALPGEVARIDARAKALPPALAPAVLYQKLFETILAGVPEANWSDEMKRLAAAPGDDGTTRAMRDLGKIWVARLEMGQINEILRNYYRREIRFPETLATVDAELPEPLKRDPWGEPWVYKPQAPEDFSTLSGQSYQLGPTRYPKLTFLRATHVNRKVSAPAWKIRVLDAGGAPALEFRSAAGTALIQAGGSVDGCALVYIGQGWALLAQVDQLFTVSF